MDSTRAALEAALAAAPDDAALHAAYADLLIEAGDPRGEYIRLRLALGDPDQPAGRLRELEQRAFELRRAHEADWLGPLNPFVNPPRGPSVGAMVNENVAVTWKRGWVDTLEVQVLTPALAAAVPACPVTRLVRHFSAHGTADDPPTAEDFLALFAFLASTPVSHVELHTPAVGDAVVDPLVRSGLLRRPVRLNLSAAGITDEGAEALARCPDVPRLPELLLPDNFLSPVGIEALARVGVTVSPLQMFGPGFDPAEVPPLGGPGVADD